MSVAINVSSQAWLEHLQAVAQQLCVQQVLQLNCSVPNVVDFEDGVDD